MKSVKVSLAMVEAGVNALANSRRLSDEMIVGNIFRDMMKAHEREEAEKRHEPAPPYVHQSWPSYRFGPNGSSKLCHSADDVPEGWLESPPAEPVAVEKKPAPQKRAA